MSTVAEFLTNLKGKYLPPYDLAVLTFPKKEPLADKILTGKYKRPGLEREREKKNNNHSYKCIYKRK